MKPVKLPEKKADLPVWYYPEVPLGSAARYIASLSPYFNEVRIFELKNKSFVLETFVGPDFGPKKNPKTKSKKKIKEEKILELVVLIKNKKGKALGQVTIHSYFLPEFSPEEVEAVRQVAKELGELWPE